MNTHVKRAKYDGRLSIRSLASYLDSYISWVDELMRTAGRDPVVRIISDLREAWISGCGSSHG